MPLFASDITFGDLFQREDYATCIVGKWKQTRGTKAIHGKDYISEFGWDEFCCFDVVTEGYRMIDPDIVENGEQMNYKGIDPETIAAGVSGPLPGLTGQVGHRFPAG